ncbi:MAG: hypothetical protein ACJA1N_001862, partial [Saprospiraceae bacterium]
MFGMVGNLVAIYLFVDNYITKNHLLRMIRQNKMDKAKIATLLVNA